MNIAKITPNYEMVSLPIGDLEEMGPVSVTISPDSFDRLVIIMTQAFNTELFAKSVGEYLYNRAHLAIREAAEQLVEEVPLGRFLGWNNPEPGGSGDTTLPAA